MFAQTQVSGKGVEVWLRLRHTNRQFPIHECFFKISMDFPKSCKYSHMINFLINWSPTKAE